MKPPNRLARRGYTLFAVLALLVTAMTMFAGWARESLNNYRQTRGGHERAQAAWLAYSGLARGAARRRADAGYVGEVWRLAPEETGCRDAAELSIEVLPADGPGRRVVCRVRLPPGGDRRVQLTRTLTLPPADGNDSTDDQTPNDQPPDDQDQGAPE